jgi:hypothetical protein
MLLEEDTLQVFLPMVVAKGTTYDSMLDKLLRLVRSNERCSVRVEARDFVRG